MSQTISINDLVAIRKSKVTLTLKKPACVEMCIIYLSKVLMYEFYYDYIKNKYGNKSGLLFTDTDSLMYEVKSEEVYEDFSKDKKLFDCSNYSAKSKYYGDWKKAFLTGAAIKVLFWLKPKMYFFLVDDSSEHKKPKGVNKIVLVTISHNEYKTVLLNNKY